MVRSIDMDELGSAVGTHLGFSEWHEIDQGRIDRFAEATLDQQWIHVDRERAAASAMGTTIVHGWLVVALIPQLTREIYAVQGMTSTVNYGADRIRFLAPVPAGAVVRVGVELLDLVTRPDGVRITSRASVERQGSAKPVCVADVLSLIRL